MLKFLTYSIAILFVFLLLVLSFNARFAADDYYFIYLKNNLGAIGGTIYQYKSFSGRWLCHYSGLLLLKFSELKYFLPCFFIFTFTTFYLILSSLFYKIYNWFDISESDFNSDFPPLLFLATFFLTSFSIGENWFWFISVVTYMWSLIFILLLTNLYLNQKKRFYTKFLILFASLYIGSASESFALLALVFGLTFIIHRIRLEGIESFKVNEKNKTVILSVSLIFLSFLISSLSPGTFNRNEMLPATTWGQKLITLLHSTGKIFINYIPSKIGLFTVFSLPWAGFGFYIQEITSLTTNKIFKYLGLTIILSVIAIVLSLAPTSFILSETGPARALSIVTLIITISFAITFTLLGMFLRSESQVIKLSFAGYFFAMMFLFYFNIKEYKRSKVYSETYDERINHIHELQKSGFNEVAEFEPLPNSGMLYNAELSTDTNYFVNQHWKKGLGLQFELSLSQ